MHFAFLARAGGYSSAWLFCKDPMGEIIMKILAILGSPKGKGSGYRIEKMIEDRMKAMGDVEFTHLFLKDADPRLCTGCYTCMAQGEDKCPLKDDRAAIEQDLLAADGVILSSPLYVPNISWLMKNFIDRFAYTNHRPRFHRQKVLTIVNMGGDDPKTALSLPRSALGGSRTVHELGGRDAAVAADGACGREEGTLARSRRREVLPGLSGQVSAVSHAGKPSPLLPQATDLPRSTEDPAGRPRVLYRKGVLL